MGTTITKPTRIQTNGVELHVMQAGKSSGAPVILLHGFPEFWYGWHHQMTPLADAGYHVIVPDQRGYNLSDKPKDIAAYRVDELVKDIIGLIDHYGYDKVRLAGHDWGALVAWHVAMWHPERLQQLVIANVPHPYIFSRFLRSNPQQFFKSWYAGAFQIPLLPEFAAQANNYALFSGVLKQEVPTLSEQELDLYREAWSQDGALSAMINWYRAYIQKSPVKRTDGRITVPTLMLWGMDDFALSREMAEPSIEMCDEGNLVFFKDTGHFVQHLKAARVSELMIEFFGGATS